MQKTIGIAAALFFIGLGAGVAEAQAVGGVVNACVDQSNGSARVLVPGLSARYAVCGRTEVAVSWNIAGPAGPAGAPGPRGPTGPQGPEGPQGSGGALPDAAAQLLSFFSVGGPDGKDITITGANLHLVSGSGATDGPVNGLGNLIIGYDEGENLNVVPVRHGSHNLVLGVGNSYDSYAGIVTGFANATRAPYAAAFGGWGNQVVARGAVVIGGTVNRALGEDSVVIAGAGKQTTDWLALSAGHLTDSGTDVVVAGANLHVVSGSLATNGPVNGLGNLIIGYDETLGMSVSRGGSHNLVMGVGNSYQSYGGIVGGSRNFITAPFSSVLGGDTNAATGLAAVVLGGVDNVADAVDSTVAGGVDVRLSDASLVGAWAAGRISGGRNAANDDDVLVSSANLRVVNGLGSTATHNGVGNVIIGYDEASVPAGDRFGSHNLVVGTQNDYASYGGIVAGLRNTVTGPWSVAFGEANTAEGQGSTVLGGGDNHATSHGATVTGGHSNAAAGDFAVVSGGWGNNASSQLSAIGGGRGNLINPTASFSTISGGLDRTADQQDQWIGGSYSTP